MDKNDLESMFMDTVMDIKQPKDIAEITICGCVKYRINDSCDFIIPTEKQRKNLKEMLCIDVKML